MRMENLVGKQQKNMKKSVSIGNNVKMEKNTHSKFIVYKHQKKKIFVFEYIKTQQ